MTSAENRYVITVVRFQQKIEYEIRLTVPELLYAGTRTDTDRQDGAHGGISF